MFSLLSPRATSLRLEALKKNGDVRITKALRSIFEVEDDDVVNKQKRMGEMRVDPAKVSR